MFKMFLTSASALGRHHDGSSEDYILNIMCLYKPTSLVQSSIYLFINGMSALSQIERIPMRRLYLQNPMDIGLVN